MLLFAPLKARFGGFAQIVYSTHFSSLCPLNTIIGHFTNHQQICQKLENRVSDKFKVNILRFETLEGLLMSGFVDSERHLTITGVVLPTTLESCLHLSEEHLA